MGTSDGLAKAPYIRESRRIAAKFTVCEHHLSPETTVHTRGADRLADKAVRQRAEQFADSVGVGYYRIDLHPSTGGDNYIDIGCLPFQIPLGALVPVRVTNLLPACKNIGTTHITNGCYRLHPVEWAIGEASGCLASFCLQHSVTPQQVHSNCELIAKFQSMLRKDGVELEWPEKVHQEALQMYRDNPSIGDQLKSRI